MDEFTAMQSAKLPNCLSPTNGVEQKSFSSSMEPKDSSFCSYSIYLISSHILLGLAVFLSHAFSLHSGCQSFSVPSMKSNITVKNSAQNDDHTNPLRPAYGFA